MRMKKFFVLTLITFAFLLAQLALPPNAVTVDNDVGITYVMPDQDQDVNYVIEMIPAIGESDYSCTQEKLSLIRGNEISYEMESTYGTCYVDDYKYRQNCLSSTDNTTIEWKGNIPENRLRGVSRLDIGESCNWQNIA